MKTDFKKKKNAKSKKRIQKRRWKRISISILFGIILFISILFVAFGMIRAAGKKSLRNKTGAGVPDLAFGMQSVELTKNEEAEWQEGWVKYHDKIYVYNEEILTFLFMGIDKDSAAEAVGEGTDGGSADALFLAVMNPKQKMIQVIGINRNTMTNVDIYNEEGEYVTTKKAQIAIAHGFGDGMEKSCEYQRKAVSELFYHLPIHGYAAVNMSAIPLINDAVGGVDVKVLEDLSAKDKTLVKGAEVHLMGESAFWYVKYRDPGIFGSADMRLARQKQYLNAFIRAAKEAVKKDVGTAARIYQEAASMMVTDIGLEEVAYLAPLIVDYSFYGEDSFRMLEGETVMGEKFEEFYVDETALYEMILEVFYEQKE